MPQSRSTQKRGLISKVLLLLLVIYLVDISLGLPDSLLGSGWPDMHLDLNVPASYAGFITMIIAANTIISSLLSTRMTLKFGAGVVTFISILLTAIACWDFHFPISSSCYVFGQFLMDWVLVQSTRLPTILLPCIIILGSSIG